MEINKEEIIADEFERKKLDFNSPIKGVYNWVEVNENGFFTVTDDRHTESRVIGIEEPRFPGDDRTRISVEDSIVYHFKIQHPDQINIINQLNSCSIPMFTIIYFTEENINKVLDIEFCEGDSDLLF